MASVGGVMVSIDAFQALDPGSIPGHRNPFNDSPNSRSFYSNCINQSERRCRKRNDSKKKIKRKWENYFYFIFQNKNPEIKLRIF